MGCVASGPGPGPKCWQGSWEQQHDQDQDGEPGCRDLRFDRDNQWPSPAAPPNTSNRNNHRQARALVAQLPPVPRRHTINSNSCYPVDECPAILAPPRPSPAPTSPSRRVVRLSPSTSPGIFCLQNTKSRRRNQALLHNPVHRGLRPSPREPNRTEPSRAPRPLCDVIPRTPSSSDTPGVALATARRCHDRTGPVAVRL